VDRIVDRIWSPFGDNSAESLAEFDHWPNVEPDQTVSGNRALADISGPICRLSVISTLALPSITPALTNRIVDSHVFK
jgi:hypothetical protein